MQVKVLLEEWLQRIPEFWIAEDDEPIVKSGTAIAMTHLPIRW
jgi:hypothetical protein